MARRLQTVVYDCDPSYLTEKLYDADALASGVDREPCSIVRLSLQMSRANRYRLRPAGTGYYDTTTAQTITQAARGGAAVREWAAIELFYEEPDDTTVSARLHDGDGTSFYWTAGAWAVAGASDWNTPAEVVTNFSSLAISGATGSRSIGVEWKIETTDKETTPYVYGALIAARLLFAGRSGTTGTGTGASSWADDSIHKVLLPWLKANVLSELVDERQADEPTTVIDYSGGLGDGQPDYFVSTVQAVYDLDSDPEMLSPLSGSWDSGYQHYTLDSELARGTSYAVSLIYEVPVAHTGDWSFFTATHPQILVDTYGPVRRRSGLGSIVVRDTTAETAIRIPEHEVTEYRVAMIIMAQDSVEEQQIEDAVRRAFNGKGGVVLVSDNTGIPHSLHGFRDGNPSRGLQGSVYGARFALTMLTREYGGEEETAYLLGEDGLDLTVGGTATVANQR